MTTNEGTAAGKGSTANGPVTLRDTIARWLWKHDGLPASAYDTGTGIRGCRRGQGGKMDESPEAAAELRVVYRASAGELLEALGLGDIADERTGVPILQPGDELIVRKAREWARTERSDESTGTQRHKARLDLFAAIPHDVAAPAATPRPGGHVGTLEREFGTAGWTPACSCGWRGSARSTDAAATTSLWSHYGEVGRG